MAPKYWQEGQIQSAKFDKSAKFVARKYNSCNFVLSLNYPNTKLPDFLSAIQVTVLIRSRKTIKWLTPTAWIDTAQTRLI